jgi:hypothetical protein
MRIEMFGLRRRASARLCVLAGGVLVGALLVAASPASASAAACATVGAQVTCTFSYNGTTGSDGTPQNFVVPPGVTSVTIEAWGATGEGNGAPGGYVKGTVTVTPTETLTVRVGGFPAGTTGGYNGGGNSLGRMAGGGASDVRQGGDALTNRIVVAGGGGGGSAGFPINIGSGGDGGGPNGGVGTFCDFGCGGGSPTQGGKGGVGSGCGSNGGDGRLAVGGDGGNGCGFFAGGGGGGLYGGGGGTVSQAVVCIAEYCQVFTEASGGGGGSGFVTPTATNQTNEAGRAIDGSEVTITYTPGNIVGASFKNCNTLHVVYNRFITGTVVQWRVTTNGVGTVASGQFSAIGGGPLGSKTYHFLDIGLGTTLKPDPVQSHVLFTWANGGRFYATRDPGC